jgi:GTP pyrophosphokinase
MAGCCRPVPLVPIVGYVTGTGYVSVHRVGCVSLKRRVPERIHPASWVVDDTLGRDISVRITVSGGRDELAEVVESLDGGGVRLMAVSREPAAGDGTALVFIRTASRERLKTLKKKLARDPKVLRAELVE